MERRKEKKMGRILLVGDKKKPRYHSLVEITPFIQRLKQFHEVVVSEDYPQICKEELSGFDLVLNYIDNWEERGNKEAEQALYEYFIEGGRILTLHGGIILKQSDKLLGLHGATFKGHEEYDLLTYTKSEKEHPITKGMESFSIHDEPYEFDFFPDKELDIFLSYTLNDKVYPAGWTSKDGEGRLVYFAFGHSESTFVENAVQELVLKGIEWLLKIEE